MTRIPLVAPHWLGADETRWPNSFEVLENFGTVLCCDPIEWSSGISSRPSVGVGLRIHHYVFNKLSKVLEISLFLLPQSWNVKTFCRSGWGQGVLGRGGRVGAGRHPHWTLQHIVKVSVRDSEDGAWHQTVSTRGPQGWWASQKGWSELFLFRLARTTYKIDWTIQTSLWC